MEPSRGERSGVEYPNQLYYGDWQSPDDLFRFTNASCFAILTQKLLFHTPGLAIKLSTLSRHKKRLKNCFLDDVIENMLNNQIVSKWSLWLVIID